MKRFGAGLKSLVGILPTPLGGAHRSSVDKWHLDEVAITSNGEKHWLWRAVDQDGFVLDALVHSRRDRRAGERLLRKLMRKQARAARVLVTDKLRYYGAARTGMGMKFERR